MLRRGERGKQTLCCPCRVAGALQLFYGFLLPRDIACRFDNMLPCVCNTLRELGLFCFNENSWVMDHQNAPAGNTFRSLSHVLTRCNLRFRYRVLNSIWHRLAIRHQPLNLLERL
jgi:hypothetical protein